MNYQRIYRQKVRDMAYKGVRVTDGPSDRAWKFLETSENYLKKLQSMYKRMDNNLGLIEVLY